MEAASSDAHASRSGLAHFALLFGEDDRQTEIELELRGASGEKREEQREISLQQVLFEQGTDRSNARLDSGLRRSGEKARYEAGIERGEIHDPVAQAGQRHFQQQG